MVMQIRCRLCKCCCRCHAPLFVTKLLQRRITGLRFTGLVYVAFWHLLAAWEENPRSVHI